jgi:hypothetical protein
MKTGLEQSQGSKNNLNGVYALVIVLSILLTVTIAQRNFGPTWATSGAVEPVAVMQVGTATVMPPPPIPPTAECEIHVQAIARQAMAFFAFANRTSLPQKVEFKTYFSLFGDGIENPLSKGTLNLHPGAHVRLQPMHLVSLGPDGTRGFVQCIVIEPITGHFIDLSTQVFEFR